MNLYKATAKHTSDFVIVAASSESAANSKLIEEYGVPFDLNWIGCTKLYRNRYIVCGSI